MKYLSNVLKVNVILTSFALSMHCSAFADTYQPAPDDIIASWDAKALKINSIQEANTALNAARYMSASGFELQQVAAFIQRQENQAKNKRDISPDLILLKAKLLQRQHQFDAALSLLTNTPALNNSPNQWLLLSDITTNMGNPEAARDYCKKLIGNVNYAVALTCLLNAEFAISPTQDTYNKLNKISEITATSSASESTWVSESLANMAFTLGDYTSARHHLASLNFEDMPISTQLLWADILLADKQPDVLINAFRNISVPPQKLDDALLLRWVMAEELTGVDASPQREVLDEVMQLRTWRKDASHAAQVAQYYLDVEYQPRLALTFARLNWTLAKTNHDKTILDRALKASSDMTADSGKN